MRIGSRDSKLAVIQAEEIINKLGVPCELITMKTTGDMILDRTLDKVGGKGLFVKELDRALMSGEVDLTVHSLKDVPMEQPEGFPLVAYSKREDPRDVLVLPKNITNLDTKKPIGCSSARRRVQLKRLFPDMEIKPVRGNIQTRLKKLDSGEYSALVLAAAGLHRLCLKDRISKYFSTDEILPAAGQGILAVQGKANTFTDILKHINNVESELCATAERAFITEFGGGCFSPIAAYATVYESEITLQVMYSSEDESKLLYRSDVENIANAKQLGIRLAQQIKKEVQFWK